MSEFLRYVLNLFTSMHESWKPNYYATLSTSFNIWSKWFRFWKHKVFRFSNFPMVNSKSNSEKIGLCPKILHICMPTNKLKTSKKYNFQLHSRNYFSPKFRTNRIRYIRFPINILTKSWNERRRDQDRA